MKRWAVPFLFIGALCWIAHVRTDGFSPSLIQGALLNGPSIEPNREAVQILGQRFTYLAKGRQAFVFESEDRKYVLKFFNQKYLEIPWYGFLVGKKEKVKRATRRFYYENSYPIAFQELGEEILYLHLSPSMTLPTVLLVDRASGEYPIDLNSIPFVLQRKGVPFREALEEILETRGIEGILKVIDSFVEAVSLRISKQIGDGDRNVMDNWGYVDGHIFHLDPGRLYYKELKDSKLLEQEWESATHDFHKWLKKKCPEGASYFLDRGKAQLNEIPSRILSVRIRNMLPNEVPNVPVHGR